MRLAIVSDTHDNMANFKKAIQWLNDHGVERMLHCGDICNREIIDNAQEIFKGTIDWVRGNGDFHLDEIPQEKIIECNGKKIFFNHYPDIAQKAAESGKYDAVFYGHTHKPWLEQIPVRRSFSEGGGECILANPGELAGQRFKPTFAIYDTANGKLELKILEKL